MNYYNEYDPKAAAWIRELIAGGHIPDGFVDERSIADIHARDLEGFDQCHFFCGIAGWPLALQLAGWPTDRPVWTGSCPCQPFSVAGRQGGFDDKRHLWPIFHKLIAECRPPAVFGEQVAGKTALQWVDLLLSDLEASNYSCGAASLCAYAVGAPHQRQRLYWAAYAAEHGRKGVQRSPQAQVPQDWAPETLDPWHGSSHPFEQWQKLLAESHVTRVDDGVSSTVDIRPRLHAYGNAIVPQVAAHFIQASLEALAEQNRHNT